MGLFGWLKREPRPAETARVFEWRQQWAAVAAAPTSEQIETLSRALQELSLSDDDSEIEREMIEGLERVVALASSVAEHGLPRVETGHRIVRADVCHFSAPASMPDDPGQPAGRLLLTSARAAFAGGPVSRTIPWHTIGEVHHEERDVVLIRGEAGTAHRFRCNSYGDALCAAFLARQLHALRRAGARRI